MSRIKAFSLLLLPFNLVTLAQDSSTVEKLQLVHFEFAANVQAGLNRPGMKRGRDHHTNEIEHKPGTFNSAGLQAELAFNWLSLCVEGSYAYANYSLNYKTDYTQKTGGTSSSADLKLGIQKAEFAVFPRLKVGTKQRFSVHLGFYLYAEVLKMASGNYNYYSSWYDPTVSTAGPGPHYITSSEQLHFDKTEMSPSSGGGILTGFGYSIPLKKQTALSFHLRAKLYTIDLDLHDEYIRSTDLGLVIAYTFYSNKK